MIDTNDLIGLTRAWGAAPGDGSGTVDCCLLAAEIHKRLGYHDYTADIQHFFDSYNDDTLPATAIARWLLQNGRRIREPQPHAIVMLPNTGVGALGTVLDDGRVLYISEYQGVVVASLPPTIGHYFLLNK